MNFTGLKIFRTSAGQIILAYLQFATPWEKSSDFKIQTF